MRAGSSASLRHKQGVVGKDFFNPPRACSGKGTARRVVVGQAARPLRHPACGGAPPPRASSERILKQHATMEHAIVREKRIGVCAVGADWVPAFAGMTKGGRKRCLLRRPLSTHCGHSAQWIPCSPVRGLWRRLESGNVAEIKDSGREFHWSRPRIMGLVFALAASPIWIGFASFGHEALGTILWFAACIGLLIAYVRPSRFRRCMQRWIPTSAERAERSRIRPS